MTEYHNIPTLYRHILFRSRLEAKWAAFFDLCGWRWEYEPADFDGWIPDFFLIGKEGYFPVEVKPINWTSESELIRAADAPNMEKIRKGKNKREVLILGSYIFYDTSKYMDETESCIGALYEGSPEYPSVCDPACMALTQEISPKLDYRAKYGVFTHRLSNEYYGGHCAAPSRSRVKRLWAEASNTVQWARA